MSFRKCPTCSHELSPETTLCPYCGRRIAKKLTPRQLFGAVWFGLCMAAALFSLVGILLAVRSGGNPTGVVGCLMVSVIFGIPGLVIARKREP